MMDDRVTGEPIETRSSARVQPRGGFLTPRALLLGPAVMQVVVAYLLFQELRGRPSEAGVLAPVILLALGGAGGLGAGLLSRSRRVFRLGILCSLLGFALTVVIQTAATPVDKDTSVVLGLGTFDAAGLGTLMFTRVLLELPFWVLCALLAIVGYLGSRRPETGTVARQISSDPRPR